MPQNKNINIGPVILSAVLTTNIINPNITSVAGPVGFTMTQPYLLIRKITISNKTGTAATFSLWKGATGANLAGTEIIGTGMSVAANSSVEKYFQFLRLDAADFLVGGSGTAAALTFEAQAEIGISG